MNPPDTPCAIVLATLLQYARVPLTANSAGWVGFSVPKDFIDVAEAALAEALEKS